MNQETEFKTLKDWVDALQPIHGGMAIILREEWREKRGEIYIAPEARTRSSRTSRIGIILKMSANLPYFNGTLDEDAVDRKRVLAPGMKVEFDPPNPIIAGHSLLWKFDKEYPIQKVHVSDIHSIWNGPITWDADAMVQEIIKEQRESYEMAMQNVDPMRVK